MSGCREEPTIVIKFEPNDLSGRASIQKDLSGIQKAAGAQQPGDLGTAAAAAANDAAGGAVADKPGKPQAAECKQASDCALVAAECCGCNNGGRQQAIAKSKQAALQAAWKARCAKTMCPMVMSQDPSCAQSAGCVEGQCVLVGGIAKKKS